MESQSFIDFLDAWGGDNPPSMLYREGDDFAAWQERFRDAVASLLRPVPGRAPAEPEIIETVDEPDHVRHTLSIPVSAFSSVPAYLLVPRDLAPGERRPGLLVLHGHMTYGIDSLVGLRPHENEGERKYYALFAVRSGYVALVPALWGWPGRDGHLGFVREGFDKCNQIQMAAGMYGLSLTGLHIQDLQASLDALAARPEVDGSRLGCMGNSTGGRMTMWLAAFDERVRACVPAGCMNHFRERSLKLTSCGIQYPYGLLRYGDVPEVFSLIAPRAVQLQAGTRDALINDADRDHIERTVRKAYRELGAAENYDYQLFEDGHILRWDLAEPFLKKCLG